MAQEIQPQRQPAQAIAVEAQGMAGMRHLLFHKSTQEQIFASLPPTIMPEKFAALCLDQLQAMFANLSADLQERVLRKPDLVLRASQRTAALGLYPGKGSSEVAWIFRKGWVKGNGEQVPDSIDVMPQWQGFLRLMRQAQHVVDVEPVLVHSLDTFIYRNGDITHEFDPFDERREFLHPSDPRCMGFAERKDGKGKVIEEAVSAVPHGLRGGYLRITFDDGRVKYHLVNFAKIDANRRCAKDPGDKGGDAVWAKWYVEQVTKTIVRDAAARRVVDWSVDHIEQVAALERATREVEEEDPRRGGYIGVGQAAPALPAGAPQEALGVDAPTQEPEKRSTGTQRLKERLGVPEPKSQTVEVDSGATAPADELCPCCARHLPDLKGQMSEEHGCPHCEGKKS